MRKSRHRIEFNEKSCGRFEALKIGDDVPEGRECAYRNLKEHIYQGKKLEKQLWNDPNNRRTAKRQAKQDQKENKIFAVAKSNEAILDSAEK